MYTTKRTIKKKIKKKRFFLFIMLSYLYLFTCKEKSSLSFLIYQTNKKKYQETTKIYYNFII